MEKNERRFPLLDNEIFMMLIIMPFLKPTSFEYIAPFLEKTFDALKIVSFAVILFMYIYNGTVSKIILSITAYEAVLFFSTVINGGDYWRLAVTCGTIIGFSMITELGLTKNAGVYIRSSEWMLIILVLINLFTILAFPEGIYVTNYSYSNNWFLGYDNVHILYTLPALCCYFTDKLIKQTKINLLDIAVLAALTAAAFITKSATSIVAEIIIIVYILFFIDGKLNSILNIITYVAVNILLFIMFLILRMQAVFSFIIEYLLGKNLNFTGRTDIWDRALVWFRMKPLLGLGVCSQEVDILRLKAFHCHNYYLQILYQSGYLGMLFFIVIMAIVSANLYRTRHNRISSFIAVVVFSFLTAFQMEAYRFIMPFFGIITMACNIDPIIEYADKSKTAAEKKTNKNYIYYRMRRRS